MSLTENPENSNFFFLPASVSEDSEIQLSHPEKVFRLVKINQHRRWVVVKSLNPQFQTHPAWQECLTQEFETGYRLNHPNLIQYYHLESHGNTPCIIREWVDGQTLAEWSMQPHTKKERIEVLRQLLEVTHYLHQHLLYHRDLSPYNVLITHRSRQVKVLDFGFAAMENDTPLAAGTLEWSAPEQLKGAIPAPSGDLYSIGRISQLLFPETNSPAPVRKLITACLQSNPDLRPPTALQALQLLESPTRSYTLGVVLIIVFLLVGLGIWGWFINSSLKQTHLQVIADTATERFLRDSSINTDTPVFRKGIDTAAVSIHKDLQPSQSFSLTLKPELEQKAYEMSLDLLRCYSQCRDKLSFKTRSRYLSDCQACLRECTDVSNRYFSDLLEKEHTPINQHILFTTQYRAYVQPVEDSIRKSMFESRPANSKVAR